MLGPTDPERQAKLDALRRLLAGLPADETAVFQDEVDINTNPKIGSMWMVKGQQAEVETPGNNEKRYLSGSIHWRTGQVFLTEGRPKQGRDTALFLAHLDDLRRRLRRYRKIHVICDRAKCHTSDEVAVYLWEHRDRIDLHLLPAYSPDCNPIERVWWHLHEAVTRNHQCKSMQELLDLTFAWLAEPEPVQGRGVGLPEGEGRTWSYLGSGMFAMSAALCRWAAFESGRSSFIVLPFLNIKECGYGGTSRTPASRLRSVLLHEDHDGGFLALLLESQLHALARESNVEILKIGLVFFEGGDGQLFGLGIELVERLHVVQRGQALWLELPDHPDLDAAVLLEHGGNLGGSGLLASDRDRLEDIDSGNGRGLLGVSVLGSRCVTSSEVKRIAEYNIVRTPKWGDGKMCKPYRFASVRLLFIDCPACGTPAGEFRCWTAYMDSSLARSMDSSMPCLMGVRDSRQHQEMAQPVGDVRHRDSRSSYEKRLDQHLGGVLADERHQRQDESGIAWVFGELAFPPIMLVDRCDPLDEDGHEPHGTVIDHLHAGIGYRASHTSRRWRQAP